MAVGIWGYEKANGGKVWSGKKAGEGFEKI